MRAILEDIEYFIEDFETKSQIELVEGKEKSELERVSEARGMKIKGSRDLAVFKTVYAFTNRPNKNGAILPQKELLKVLPQIIGKPISVNHNRELVVGHYIDYRYIQKENKIIAYGVFYKSNFGKLWKRAQSLFKKGKLASSFEIWSPEQARKRNPNGTYELHQMEIAGGALIYGDVEEPAFEGADVLEMAKALQKEIPQLVYASKHKEAEIISSNQWKESIEENKKKLDDEKAEVQKTVETPSQPEAEKKEEVAQETPKEEVTVEPPVVPEPPAVPKVTCAHCNNEFETIEQTNIKCPNCFSILDSEGKVVYPPQIKDFKCLCPSCRVDNWLITANREDGKSELKCMSCSNDYVVTFTKQETSDALCKLKFLYTGYVSCYQCGTTAMISGLSDQKEHEVKCKKCGLVFPVNTEKIDRNRTISSIVLKTSEERRELEVTKEQEDKVEDVKKEVTVDDKKTEEETPKVEEKVEETPKEADQVEPKKEETQKAEPKVEVVTKSSVEKTDEETTPEASEDSTKTPTEGETQDKGSDEPKAEAQDPTPEISNVEDQLPISSRSKRVERLSQTLRNAVAKIRELKKASKIEISSIKADADKSKNDEIAKIRKEADEKIMFYQANASKIAERRLELGEQYSKDLTDKDIVNDEVFTRVKLEKENAQLRAEKEGGSDIVSAKSERDDGFYSKARAEIDAKAFGHTSK